ncbi:MAG: short-chain fatty acid transporter [Firmicutes bacterium HGW-Firmicutes-12]|jgi:short-chain fatty acids transporter|nr:MAG: short-chain fatty acid transporter [Firmicutes bacterium HGW-Firmicutes-12]
MSSSAVLPKDNIVRRISRRINVSIERYLPDAFIFALVLTFVVFLMGLFIAKETPFKMITHWADGFWGFLAFSMQMVLILVTGQCIAQASLVSGWIKKLAQLPKTPAAPYVITVLVSAVAGWINWGMGLVFGALIAKQMAAQNKDTDFPLLIAAAYSGAYAGIFGLSITAPLLVNTPGHFLEEKIGLIPVSQTILHPATLITVIVIAVLTALAFKLMRPTKEEEIHSLSKLGLEVETEVASSSVTVTQEKTLASYLENSWVITLIVVIGGLLYIINHFINKGFDLNLNILNFTFLIVGLALHKSPINYVNAVIDSVKSVYGIILQFPFYAGIMGMMSGSGLISIIALWFVSFSTTFTFPFFSFLSCTVVNMFVPSAGGQWMIQGPILVEAGQALGVADNLIVNAYTYGDLCTNLIQPFWALPVLGIAGLKMKDIWGYTSIACIIYFVVSTVSLFLQAM